MDGVVLVRGRIGLFGLMTEVSDYLRSAGVDASPPRLELDPGLSSRWRMFKHDLSKRRLDEACARGVSAVLVLNTDTSLSRGYVGPGTLAEMAAAYHAGKDVYLLNEPPDVYREMFADWGVRQLSLEEVAVRHRVGSVWKRLALKLQARLSEARRSWRVRRAFWRLG